MTEACAKKFALYLYKNNHLNNFTIPKDEARAIFCDSFKKEYQIKRNFSTTFFHMSMLLKRKKDRSVIFFKKDQIKKLVNEEKNLDAVLKKEAAAKKKTLVDQNLSFKGSRKIESEIVLSPQECKLCEVQFVDKEVYNRHLKEEEHLLLEHYNKRSTQQGKETHLEFLIDGFPLSKNIILRKNERKVLLFTVRNISKVDVLVLSVASNKDGRVSWSIASPFTLKPGEAVSCRFTVLCPNDGVFDYPILFSTKINGSSVVYTADLVFHIHVDFFDDLHPTEPYKRRSKPVLIEYIESVDPGERPNGASTVEMTLKLQKYPLPTDVAVVLNAGLKQIQGMSAGQIAKLNCIKNLLNVENKQHCLNAKNYAELLDMFLYIEEHQMSKDIREYDLEKQTLKLEGHFLELEVPGLAEHRPSVIFGDAVYVRENKKSLTLYEGFVHEVRASSVLLRFSKNFMNNVFGPEKKYYISFAFNRYPLKVCHQALKLAKQDNIAHALFPNDIPETPLPKGKLKWFNEDIANNAEQQQAVWAILKKASMPAPYLIFGPPGTGKTSTVVEAVKQIYKLPNQNILICAPSNSAANVVTFRLIDLVPEKDLLRYVAVSVSSTRVPKAIRKFTNFARGNYHHPSMKEFASYRIIVTTIISAAKLVNGGCPKNHFSYVFIDEAGHSTEVDTLVPIARILSHSTSPGILTGQLVLAGDPEQLGPIIHSSVAQEYGFGISMLERLMKRPGPYSKPYNPNALTKLIKNYRSHPVIINQPNKLFYDDELQAAGNDEINLAINWRHLPNPKFPMIFHAVTGLDQREKNSPSYFNIQEIEVIMDYLEKLIGRQLNGKLIKEDDIAIISPYSKQVEKIKRACAKKKYGTKLTVGSTEQMQGQERMIIIISSVRCTSKLKKFDVKFHLGFLSNPKRFNVAITRAKALLIAIGNPNVLQHDKYWRSFISYCEANNATAGDHFKLINP